MRILIMGSGALGCYYGGRWLEKGHDVTFVARGENLSALKEKGLTIESIDGDLKIPSLTVVDTVPRTQYELIVMAVKAYDTEKALEQIEPGVDKKTLILSLQNGVDNEEKIAARYGVEQTVGGVAFIGVERLAPGIIRHTAAGNITIGPWVPALSDRVHKLVEELSTPQVLVNYSDNIRYDLWLKLLWNSAFNTTTCLAGTPASNLLQTPEGESLVRQLMEEVMAVARAEGIQLPESAKENYLTITRTMGEVRTSMLVDRERRHPLEVEALSGVIVRRGEAHGIAVPAQKVLYALLLTYQYYIESSSKR